MRSKKIIRTRGKRKAATAFDVDITSLMDVLTIILVFLISSYNSSGVVVSVPEGITLPPSESQSINNPGVIVQANEKKIWVENELVVDFENSAQQNVLDDGDRRIVPLFDQLVKKKEEAKYIAANSPDGKPFSGNINLVVDKNMKYDFLKKILHTCATAGYKTYKFVVLSENQ